MVLCPHINTHTEREREARSERITALAKSITQNGIVLIRLIVLLLAASLASPLNRRHGSFIYIHIYYSQRINDSGGEQARGNLNHRGPQAFEV